MSFAVDMTNTCDRDMFRLLQLRGALRIEVATGMHHSKGSLLAEVNRRYGETFRRKSQALDFLNDLVDEMKCQRILAGFILENGATFKNVAIDDTGREYEISLADGSAGGFVVVPAELFR